MKQTVTSRHLGLSLAGAASSVLAWEIVAYAMRLANAKIWDAINGFGIPLRNTDFSYYWRDSIAWAELAPSWFTVAIPVLVIAALFALKVNLTWKLGLWIGLCIAAAQWLTWFGYLLFKLHLSLLAPGLQFYLSQMIVVIPGPLAAVAASKLNFAEKEA